MDFEEAKENIQPLVRGRNASILCESLKEDAGKQLTIQRQHLEKEIHTYSGDDPLSVWYNYLYWIEQSYPAGGKESGLSEVLAKCLTHFENDERYYQDERMVKLFIKFIDQHKDPAECYNQLFKAGIGTMVADFYIAWAYSYDLLGNYRKADEIFRRGIACRAQPLNVLKEAHQHFGFVVAQRIMYKNDNSLESEYAGQLDDRRKALTLLRSNKRKHIGSIRTGAAVKEATPGIIQSGLECSAKNKDTIHQVFADENILPPPITGDLAQAVVEEEKSVIRTIVDNNNKENQIEPGPWNKAYKSSSSTTNTNKLFHKRNPANNLDFDILEDSRELGKVAPPPSPIIDIRYEKSFKYPANHVAKNLPQKEWLIPITSELMPHEKAIPQYRKCMIYPRPNVEFQLEEYGCYVWLRKHNLENTFTRKREQFWNNGPNYNIRQYPHFAKQSNKQNLDSLDEFFIPIQIPGLIINFKALYNINDREERQFEEIMAAKLKYNVTIVKAIDMEETVCSTSHTKFIRKSFLPKRPSIAVPASIKQTTILSKLTEFRNQEDLASCSTDTTSSHQFPIKQSSKTPYQEVNEIMLAATSSTTVHINEMNCESSTNIPKKKQEEYEKNFKFKTPLLPPPSQLPSSLQNDVIPVKNSNNLPFEIFEDSIASKSRIETDSIQPIKAVNFDGDETCSTHIFNKFLKIQSVSTPKPANKTIKLSTTKTDSSQLTEAEEHPEQIIATNINRNLPLTFETNDNIVTTANPNATSPPSSSSSSIRKLSTILETSEHGTTQSTHTTGTTTKSTISSPENDNETKLQPQPQPQIIIQPATINNKEQSLQNRSTTNQASGIDVSKEIEVTPITTPSAVRFTSTSLKAFNFSIFEERLKYDILPKNVGNFSRLEERNNDSAAEELIRQPIQYHTEDKIDSLSKLFLASPVDIGKFPEDKTETIPPPTTQFLIKSFKNKQFDDDDDDDDDDQTTGSLLASKPELIAIRSQTRDTTSSNIEKCQDTEDLLEFFAKSPPKSSSSFNKMKTDSSFKSTKLNKRDNNDDNVNLYQNKHDSFLPEFSFNTALQQQQQQQKEVNKLIVQNPHSVENDSFSKRNYKPVNKITGDESICKLVETSRTSVASETIALNHLLLMDTFVKDFTKITCNEPTPTSNKMTTTTQNINKNCIIKTFIQNKDNNSFVGIDDTFPNNHNLSKLNNSRSPTNNSIMVKGNKLGFLNSIKKKEKEEKEEEEEEEKEDIKTSSSISTTTEKLSTTADGKMSSDQLQIAKATDEFNIFYKYNEKIIMKHNDNEEEEDNDADEEQDDDDNHDDDYHHKISSSKDNKYQHVEYDLNQTQQLLDNIRVDQNINPFNVDLINAFLEHINFINYIENLPNCELIRHVGRLLPKTEISIHQAKFEITKLIDSGAYGSIYSGKNLLSNKKYAFKREKPANFWEYYICLELQDRIKIDDMLPAFMSVDYALIGNNASILITPLSEYGSLITICNKIKAQTMKNIDEYIVMLLTSELLQIIDHLHAANIIHADIKADNFLLINRLCYPNMESQRYIQLIDFGVSIDMKLFNPNQTFTYVHKDKSIQCIEMREGRAWTYQLDLYGLAGVIHVLLFGKYMDVEQKTTASSNNTIWMPKTHIPRYYNRTLWETVFKNLLNITNCSQQQMPNLQQLRALLQEEMEEKRAHLIRMIVEFNQILLS